MSWDPSADNLPNTPFVNGTNLTGIYNGVCMGNQSLCLNNNIGCTLQNCDLTLADFLYIPNLGGNAFYAALFAVALIAQVFLGIKYKTWGYMVAAVGGLIIEVIGYIGRIMIHSNPFDNSAFLMYLVCLTIAPAFLSAAIYLCLARIVVVYGEAASRIRPRTYTIIFMSCDFFSLLLQAIGGGIASAATDYNTSQNGIHIMMAGLSFQVASLLIFALLCAEFAFRLRSHPQGWNLSHEALYSSGLFRLFLFGLGVATLTIFIRSCFRVAELSGGFRGYLANNEATFMVLEGGMISIAVICLTLLHPGFCFQGAWTQANFKLRGAKGATKGSPSDSSSLEDGTTRFSMRAPKDTATRT